MIRLLKCAALILAVLALAAAAFAQQPAASQPAAKPPAVVPKGKIAVINTAALQEQINEFKAKIEALNREFELRVKEVQGLADKITSLENTIKTQANVLSPAKIAESTEQLEAMKREYQRKGEDLQADGSKARDAALAPINQKLSNFVKEYTARRGIVFLVDLANDPNANLIVWVDTRADVTQDFINAYNRANPVPAAATAPLAPPRKP
ncbi:MAG TPA: OmpH family outer membrane protein [Blastocatellia bacterium]|nr:OmpH family outer membrane protein [Blastocatellia bacterium]